MSGCGAIFYWDVEGGFGTGHDVTVIRDALRSVDLRERMIVVHEPSSHKERLALAARRLLSLDVRCKLQIFLQFGFPEQMWFGRTNLVFPNYEHTHPDWIRQWSRADQFACKTRYTERLINALGGRSTYVGFQSADEQAPAPNKTFREFLHVSGRSAHKGTYRMLEVWMRRPDWPLLTVTRSFDGENAKTEYLTRFDAPNIRIIGDYLPAAELAVLKNRVGIHLCPSEAEGFGHYIRNAMSTGAVVLTTDAPPMNEHITPDTGVLVPASASAPSGFGELFLFDESAFERSIDHLLATPETQLAEMAKRARERFLILNGEFPNLFGELLHTLRVIR